MKIGALELGKEQLCRSHVIAVGPEAHERYLEGLQETPRLRGGVVGGTIPDDDGVFAPVLVLSIQHLNQLCQVDLHGLCIVVGLKQADEDLAKIVNAGNQGDPRMDDDLLLSYTTFFGLPAAPLVPHGVQPALVDVDEAPLGLDELEEEEGTLLARDKVLNRVGPRSKPNDLLVAQADYFLHDVANLVLL